MDEGRLINAGGQTKSGAAGVQFLTDDHDLSGAAGLELVTDESSTAHFVATIGWSSSDLSDNAKQLLEPGRIDKTLDEKAASYARRRPHIKGLFGEAPEAIGNSMFWNTLYVPSLGLEFPTISRH
jgi:hypothetical protein